jgi:hypothetical protein
MLIFNLMFIRWTIEEAWGNFKESNTDWGIQKPWAEKCFDIVILHDEVVILKSKFFPLQGKNFTEHKETYSKPIPVM